MTYEITTKCVECGSCAPFCKNGAIDYNDDGKYEIDQEKCEACGTCSEYCPIDGAISEKHPQM